MSYKNSNAVNKRRLALQALTGSALMGGIVDRMPLSWQRPLVNAAGVPAHAQTSGVLAPQQRSASPASAEPRAFITTWRIDAENPAVAIPMVDAVVFPQHPRGAADTHRRAVGRYPMADHELRILWLPTPANQRRRYAGSQPRD